MVTTVGLAAVPASRAGGRSRPRWRPSAGSRRTGVEHRGRAPAVAADHGRDPPPSRLAASSAPRVDHEVGELDHRAAAAAPAFSARRRRGAAPRRCRRRRRRRCVREDPVVDRADDAPVDQEGLPEIAICGCRQRPLRRTACRRSCRRNRSALSPRPTSGNPVIARSVDSRARLLTTRPFATTTSRTCPWPLRHAVAGRPTAACRCRCRLA